MVAFPKVVIVGFPNVGKSTLFNRLAGKKTAIVHRLPGMTRDCVSALCQQGGKSFFLVDTGGFFDSLADPLADKIKEKAWDAASEARLILYVLDGRRGLLPSEQELYASLKKLGKPLFIVVNKIDSAELEAAAGDFYRLGSKQIFFISAEHRRNLEGLEEAILAEIPAMPGEEKQAVLHLAIIGRTNVGKSSLINRLCNKEKLIVSEQPGTTRDLVETYINHAGKLFSLVDTAGLRRLSRVKDEREKASIVVTRRRIRRADVLCLVMEVTEFPTHQDLAIARLAFLSGKPLVLVLNKWDLIRPEAREDASRLFRERVEQRLELVAYAPLLFISAKTGKGVFRLLDEAAGVYQNAGRRIETHSLNEFLEEIKKTNPPLWENYSGGNIKIKYMTQVAIRPPTFVLFVNREARFLPEYEKFFLQRLSHEFSLWGTPLRLKFKISR